MHVALAATVHDPGGHLLPGIRRAGAALRRVFQGAGVSATTITSGDVVAALAEHLGAAIETRPAGNAVGLARRGAVRLALEHGADRVLYSDLDHVIRWVEQAPDELTSVVTAPHAEDLVVVGRSATAFARSPARLRETEALVNHVYALATGRQADLMFAIRLLSRRAAQTIVALGTEDTIANDVEWPLLAEREGLTVGYVAADGLDYRTREDFDKPADERDRDPLAWITRVELAAQHVGVLRRFLQARQS